MAAAEHICQTAAETLGLGPDEVEVMEVPWGTHGEALMSVRSAVFIAEQGVPEELERDGRDADAVHFLAKRGGRTIGTTRLLADGQIGRVAVLAKQRRAGIGRRLLDAALAAARDRGDGAVWLNAQVEARSLYAAAGFRPVGQTFLEAGLPHIRMELILR